MQCALFMTSVSGFSKENVHYMHACSYTRYYHYHNHYYVFLLVQGRTETESNIQNGQPNCSGKLYIIDI